MIKTTLLGVQELLVYVPGMLARLGLPGVPIPNYQVAKDQKFFFDYADEFDDDAQDLLRPFFVLQEVPGETLYRPVGDELLGTCAVDVLWCEATLDVNDHKASKAYFVDFVETMFEFVATHQNKPILDQPETTFIAVGSLQLLTPARRTRLARRDSTQETRDFFEATFRFVTGDFLRS